MAVPHSTPGGEPGTTPKLIGFDIDGQNLSFSLIVIVYCDNFSLQKLSQ